MGDMLSQAEINALLNGDDSNQDNSEDESITYNTVLTTDQKDTLGEVGNISMGTSATTLFALLNQKVNITTPRVRVRTYKSLMEKQEVPCVATRVDYKEGVTGTNVLILSQKDVKIITSLMMGGDGTNINEDDELTELDLSAIGEAMNQMIGSASTSLSSMINRKVDIDTPFAFKIDFKDEAEVFEKLGVKADEEIVTVSFKIEIGTLIDSTLIQVIPLPFATELVDIVKKVNEENMAKKEKLATLDDSNQIQDMTAQNQQAQQPQGQYQQPQGQYQQPQGQYQQPQGQYQQPQGQYQQPQGQYQQPQGDVNVQSVQFQNFDVSAVMQQKENIGIIMDVPLEVTVELGRTSKAIKEILEFTPGTIIELNKLAGEPIDILVNGKFIANGEVVVIEENFGIRITDIISVENRI
jgi:flagellar motor switch protein FliN